MEARGGETDNEEAGDDMYRDKGDKMQENETASYEF